MCSLYKEERAQDAQGEDQGDIGHGQVDCRQSVLPHAPGHEDAVYDGIEREDPHGNDGWDDKFEEALEQ